SAVVLVRTRARRVGGLAHARDRRERPVDQAHDVADPDRARGLAEEVAALLPAAALEESRLLQLEEDLLEELDGDALALGELADREELAALLLRDADVDQRPEGIFPAFGEVH